MERTVKRIDRPAVKLPAMTRVAAYARVSSGKDAMLHSLSAQVSYYSELIQRHAGWQYMGVYADEAKTGTKDTRANFQRLLTDCRDGKIDLVITKSISRFARNTVTLLTTVRELKDMGVDVFFEEQNIHSMGGDGELMLTILASYAQEESLSVSENCKWYWRQRMRDGHMVGLRSMFGYDIQSGRITVNEAEATIVRCVFAQYNAGASTVGIARSLQAAGVPTVSGGRWTAPRVRDMLKNEKYTGNALLQKKYVSDHIGKRLVRNHGELPQYYAENTHGAIVDSETFALAQQRLADNYTRCNVKRPNTSRYPFSGMLICANCGKHYGRKTTHGFVSWQCQTFLTVGKAACPAKQIPESKLMEAAASALGTDTFDADAFQSKITAVRVEKDNTLVFLFKDGSETVERWTDRSRAESWTDEMKQAAREKQLARRVTDGNS